MISSRATYEQGVLFVHGIGNQKQGETLVRWGDALAHWLGDWGSRVEPGTPVRLSDVVLQPADGAPAHGDLHIGYADERVSWLIEEVWWAGDVQTPSYSTLALFTIQALPMTLFGFVGGAIRRHWLAARNAGWGRRAYHAVWLALSALVGLPLALFAAPLIAALIVLLLVIGLVPAPGVRARILAVQRALTLTVGDSMILLSSPTQRAAMTSRVIDAIRFARSRGVNRLTIVAHSQGAAVVKRALAEHPPFVPKPRLITVGSGINRLEELESQGRAGGWLAPVFLAASALVGWVLWLLEDAGEVSWTGIAAWAAGYLAVIFAVSVLAVLAPRVLGAVAARRVDRREKRLAERAADEVRPTSARNRKQEVAKLQHRLARVYTVGLLAVMLGFILLALVIAGDAFLLVMLSMPLLAAAYAALQKLVFRRPVVVSPNLEHRVDPWLDVYSNADPVPNGPTLTAKDGWPESIEVANADSMLVDHVRYEHGRDDALALIAEFALRDTHGPIQVTAADRDRIARARTGRRARLSVLRATRWIVAVAAVGFVMRWPDDVEASGRDGYTWAVDTLGLPAWLPGSIDGDRALTVGSIGVVVIALAVYWALAKVWGLWNAVEARALFAPEGSETHNAGHAVLSVLVAGWFVALYATLVLDDWTQLGQDESLLDWLEALATFGFAIFAVSLVVAGMIRVRTGGTLLPQRDTGEQAGEEPGEDTGEEAGEVPPVEGAEETPAAAEQPDPATGQQPAQPTPAASMLPQQRPAHESEDVSPGAAGREAILGLVAETPSPDTPRY